jgi:hypothetical protein
MHNKLKQLYRAISVAALLSVFCFVAMPSQAATAKQKASDAKSNEQKGKTDAHVASSDMGGDSSGGESGGGITIDFGDWGGGSDWEGGYSEPYHDPYINVYEEPYHEPYHDPYINVYEPYYEPQYEPQQHINVYEPYYEPQQHINVYQPPYYEPPVQQPAPAPTPPPAPPQTTQALPIIVIINDTPVIRVGDIFTIRIRIVSARRPVTIFWRIDGINIWIRGGEVLRRRATRPGVIPITVIVRDANGLYSQRQTTIVNVLKAPTPARPAAAPARPASAPARAPTLPKQAPIKAQPHALAGCYDTDFGILRFTVEGANVKGTYDYLGGSTLTGQLRDNVLIGTWNEPAYAENPAKSGPFQFVFTEGWKSFQGVWGNQGDDPLTGIWNGVKIVCPAPGTTQSNVGKKETLEEEQAHTYYPPDEEVPDVEYPHAQTQGSKSMQDNAHVPDVEYSDTGKPNGQTKSMNSK